ncbi:chemotaxis protein CheB [Scytonema tolypothrichoides VB-61278]|nr:chemotaxis protein CheB [Scytonema tolypothrichoides VB-61278]
MAASKGGLKAISQILSSLPAEFPAAIALVQYLHPQYRSHLAEILSSRTALQVKQAEDGELLCPGTVYIAVPNKHLVVNLDATLSLSDAPKVNFVRPAGDKLLASVGSSFKSRAIRVVLTGKDGDEVLGVLAIKKYEGTVIVQDEASSECFSMPKSAIDTGKVNFVLLLDAIAHRLVTLVSTQKVHSQELSPKLSN